MCGRATLTKKQAKVQKRFSANFHSEDAKYLQILPSYNIAPTHRHPVITGDDPKLLQFFQWGLIPFWAKAKNIGSKMINARVETLAEKPAFRQALEKRRCIVPFDGFFEWEKTDYGKIPHYIFCKDQDLFSMAGLWEKWADEQGKILNSFTLITLPANDYMRPIHNRMPAILKPEVEQDWMNPKLSVEEALAILEPYPAKDMNSYTVSEKVNKVANNDPELIEEYEYKAPPRQGNLFD